MEYLRTYNENNQVQFTKDKIEELEQELKKYHNTIKKDIKKIAADIPELKQKKNQSNYEKENEGIAVGLVLSSGVIIQLVGKLFSFMGKKLNTEERNFLQNSGKWIEEKGHKIHHGIIKIIKSILYPLIFWMSKENQEKVSNVVFMAILAFKVVTGVVDVTDIKNIGNATNTILNSIKTGEIISFLKQNSKNIFKLTRSLT